MTKDELLNRVINNHKYHPASDEMRKEDHQRIRQATKECAFALIDICPVGRELSLALTALEEVMMWANAAVARQDE